jgi:hypothetical protein
VRTHTTVTAVLDRDVAAAMVVHYRAFGFWPGSGLGALTQVVAPSVASEALAFTRR